MGFFGTRHAGFNLGALEQRGSYRKLMYEGIDNLRYFNNVCYPSAQLLIQYINRELQSRMAFKANERVVSKQRVNPPGWWTIVTGITRDDDIIQQLRRMKGEVERDISRYNLPGNVPVCLSISPVVQAHESMHALWTTVLPRYNADGSRLSKAGHNLRMVIVRDVTMKFLANVGPDCDLFMQRTGGAINIDDTEEITAGIYGMVAVLARSAANRGAGNARANLTARIGIVKAYSSYMKQGPIPKNLDAYMFRAGAEWQSVFGTGLRKVEKALRPLVEDAIRRYGQPI